MAGMPNDERAKQKQIQRTLVPFVSLATLREGLVCNRATGINMKTKDKSRSTPRGTSDGRPGATAAKGKTPSGFPIRTIIIPVDLSEPSRKALRYAFALAQQFDAKLILFYAVEPVATPDFAYHPLMMETKKVIAAAEERLQKLCAEEGIDASWVENTLVRQGVAHDQITEAALNYKADLIVIATHGHTGLKHVLLGSTAERVVRHARCPVLVVRGYG
jgi:nucleotide-binding universal stress UspA family protein